MFEVFDSRFELPRKSFTSRFIALNFILYYVKMMKSNEVTILLQIGYKLQANEQLPSLLLLFVERH